MDGGTEKDSSMDIQSVADAVAVLDYLHKRELLCDSCGDHIAEYKNQFQSRCEGCKSPHANYNKAKVPSVIERGICDSLQRWVASHPATEGRGDAGDPSYSPGTR